MFWSQISQRVFNFIKNAFNFQQNHDCPMGDHHSLMNSSEIPCTKLSARQADPIFSPFTKLGTWITETYRVFAEQVSVSVSVETGENYCIYKLRRTIEISGEE